MAYVRRINTIHERLALNRQEPLFVRRLIRVVDDCVRLVSSDRVPRETWNYCITRIETLKRNLQRAHEGSVLDDNLYENFAEILTGILEEFHNGNMRGYNEVQTGYQAERHIMTTGAPRFNISREQLAFLLQCGFKIRRMSEILGVSIRTVKRRMREYNLQIRSDHSVMTDGELDTCIRLIINGNQRMGANAVRARLFSQGHRVQRCRVRGSMLRVDPGGAALRAAPTIQRRTYCVAGPNSLWHVDGNHKLIRWKMVVHGGIDGFSRMIVFLHASANNRKETVLRHFVCAAALYGVPSRIRVDNGGENNDLCALMEYLRGADRGSAIRGKSVHNQRIERAWVDMWNGATNMYYDLFHFLEERGSLNIDNHVHMWALHYVFLPRVNRELKLFQDQWNNHGLRTSHHESPLQLFVGGALDRSRTGLTAMEDLFGGPEMVNEPAVAQAAFNDEWDRHEAVNLPEIPFHVEEDVLNVLQQTVDPLGVSDDFGIDLYLSVLELISERV